jgi:hypothetical protein
MNVVPAAMLVVLGLSAPLRALDLQVEAVTAAGVGLPELADAVARALVASGARVVLRGPTSGPCPYCAKVTVTETGPGTCRVEVRQERHTASAALHLPAGSPLFDRARAIAIQARLLVSWETSPETRGKDVAARPAVRKSEATSAVDRSSPSPELARVEPVPPPAQEQEPVASPQPEPLRAVARENPVAVERQVDTAAVAPVKYTDRADAKPTSRADSKIAEPALSEPRRIPPVDVATVGSAPPKRQWPWIPTALGAGAAVAAGICAGVARNRYDALSDKRLTYSSALALKSEGESWQVASIVLAGAAVVGLGTGMVGFATHASGRSSVGALASPIPGGGIIAVAGDLP